MFGINFLMQGSPRFDDIGILISSSAHGPVGYPLVGSDRIIPCLVKYKFVHKRVYIKAFKSCSQAIDIVSSLLEESFNLEINIIQIACYHRIAAKITQITPNIGIPVIFFSISPDFCMIAIVIE